jgi:LacI family transcriptional regulator
MMGPGKRFRGRRCEVTTIVDVARIAGVSISTVSHVLNHTRPVEPATRQRVMDAITATNYRQDALARALRRSRTDTIGLVVPDVGEPAFAGMIHGVEQAAAEADLGLVLASSAESADRESRAVDTLLNRRVDGLILARAVDSPRELLDLLKREKAATVLIDRMYADVSVDQVGVDNRGAMRRLVEHMWQQGHRRFVFIAGDTRVPTLDERHSGFLDAVAAAGLEPSDQTTIAGMDGHEQRRSLHAVLQHRSASALIAASTPLATIGLDVMTDLGLSTPGDLAFATFDGFDQHSMFKPSLTTIRQPAFDVGVHAVRMLTSRLADEDLPPRLERLEPVLELRDSTEAFLQRD